LTINTREAVLDLITQSHLNHPDYLFKSRIHSSDHLSTRQLLTDRFHVITHACGYLCFKIFNDQQKHKLGLDLEQAQQSVQRLLKKYVIKKWWMLD
jgi:hypothetical protein